MLPPSQSHSGQLDCKHDINDLIPMKLAVIVLLIKSIEYYL
jgi:hypothetical protein